MSSKFLNLFESVYQRYQHGGLEVGDYVKFIDKFKARHEYDKLSNSAKDIIDQMLKTGLNIRVVLTKPSKPTSSPGNTQDIGQSYSADIALDNGGGRFTSYLTVPAALLVTDNDYPNLNKIADSQRHKDKVNIKPEEVPIDKLNQSRLTDPGTGKLKSSSTELPTKNTSLPNQNKSPYTKSYIS